MLIIPYKELCSCIVMHSVRIFNACVYVRVRLCVRVSVCDCWVIAKTTVDI